MTLPLGKNDRYAEEELSAEEASEFRRLAGTALYLSLDRPTIQFAVNDITAGSHAHAPAQALGALLTQVSFRSLGLQVPRGPKGVGCVYRLRLGARPPDEEEHERLRGDVRVSHIETSCARQATVALSSGEAEYYALTRGVAAGRMSQQIWEIIGYKLPLIRALES